MLRYAGHEINRFNLIMRVELSFCFWYSDVFLARLIGGLVNGTVKSDLTLQFIIKYWSVKSLDRGAK